MKDRSNYKFLIFEERRTDNLSSQSSIEPYLSQVKVRMQFSIDPFHPKAALNRFSAPAPDKLGISIDPFHPKAALNPYTS